MVRHLRWVCDNWRKDINECKEKTLELADKYKDYDDEFTQGMLENAKR